MNKKIILITSLLILINFSFCFAQSILGNVLPINNKQLVGLVLFVFVVLAMIHFMGWSKYLLIGIVIFLAVIVIGLGIIYVAGTSMQRMNPPHWMQYK